MESAAASWPLQADKSGVSLANTASTHCLTCEDGEKDWLLKTHTSHTRSLRRTPASILRLKTVAICTALFFTGFAELTPGLCLVHLCLNFGVSTSDFYVVFLCQCLGLVAGSLLSAVVGPRVTCERQFAFLLLAGMSANAISPWTDLHTFAGLQAVVCFTTGYTYSLGFPYITHLWSGSKHSGAAIQLYSCTFSLSCVITPLVVGCFLVPLGASDNVHLSCQTYTSGELLAVPPARLTSLQSSPVLLTSSSPLLVSLTPEFERLSAHSRRQERSPNHDGLWSIELNFWLSYGKDGNSRANAGVPNNASFALANNNNSYVKTMTGNSTTPPATEISRNSTQEVEANRILLEEAEITRITTEEAETSRISIGEADTSRISIEEADTSRISIEEADTSRISIEKADTSRKTTQEAKTLSKGMGVEFVRWAFSVGSAGSLLSALLMVAVSIHPTSLSQPTDITMSSSSEGGLLHAKHARHRRTCSFSYFVFNVLIVLMAGAWALTTGTMSQYLQAFAIVGLSWSSEAASRLTTVFGGGQLVGRVVALALSPYVSRRPDAIIALCLAVWTVCPVLMLLPGDAHTSSIATIFGVTVAGVSLSPILPGIYQVVNQVTQLTTFQSAMVTIGENIGFQLGPIIVGFLVCSLGYTSFIFSILAGCVLQCAVFVCFVKSAAHQLDLRYLPIN